MVTIPAGAFTMGSDDGPPDERPAHQVELAAYAIDRLPVTNAQFAEFLNAIGTHNKQGERLYDFDDSDARIHQRGAQWTADAGYANHPAVEPTWSGARDYCAWRGLRLPTEAEWEKAARGGLEAKRYSWGDRLDPNLANFLVDPSTKTARGTTRCRTYPPNGFGLHEMHGNVWEYCADAGPVDYREAPTDGRPAVGPQGSRVLRGGSWSHNPAICRAAYRDSMRPEWPGWEGRVGLRVVCELEPS